jgi:hypothetical protein
VYYVLVDVEGGQEYRPVEEDLVPSSQVEQLRQELRTALEGYLDAVKSTVPNPLAELISGNTVEEIRASAERVRQAYRALQRIPLSQGPGLRQGTELSPVARIAAGLRAGFGSR